MRFVKDYSKRKVLGSSEALSLIKGINEDLLKSYESCYSSLLLPFDSDFVAQSSSLLKKMEDVDILVVVGIGGSNLGAMALIEAIKGKYHNLFDKKKVFFADTVDSDNTLSILSACKNKKFLLAFISKSGTTTESVANFEVFLKKIPVSKRKDRVVVITDEGSMLSVYAERNGFNSLFIPRLVGGRYSVFSNVGLFPLLFAGIDVKSLLLGAREAVISFNKQNVSFKGALDLYNNYLEGKNIYDLFFFSSDLESLGKWYRQLLGESVGKRFNLLGEEVFCGITPTVSMGSVDLHSVGQLYIGGPRDKFTSFISVENQKGLSVPKNLAGLPDFQGFSFQEILDAILKGTMRAYKKNKLPFNHYCLKEKSAFELGFFMQSKMLEVVILAHLLGVDAFNQPSVEDYKKETKLLLKK